ncbi:hypothetical protein Tco_1447078 [Tanacetum coccineum]
MMEIELREGYSFTKKKYFVCGSLSHLIKDCDYYEKKMARKVEFKKQRVFNTGPNMNTGRKWLIPVSLEVNTGSTNVNTVRSRQPVPVKTSNNFSPKRPQYKGNWDLLLRTSAGIIGGTLNQTLIDHPLKNMEDRFINGIVDAQAHDRSLDITQYEHFDMADNLLQRFCWFDLLKPHLDDNLNNAQKTATANTLADETLELLATIDTIIYTIIEASNRHKLQLADAYGITIHENKPPVQSPPPITAPIPASTPTPIPETDPEPMEHTFEEPSPAHQHFSPPQEHAQGQMTVDDLLQLVPQLMTRVDSLEKDLKQTKLTMGSAIVKLVKKVKKLEGILKRRNVVLSDSEEEEPEAQGRKSQDDPLVSLVQGLVTPSKTTVNASGEEQVEDISPTTLEAAKTLSRVASQKPKSIDKGRRYKRRKETKGKKVVTSLDFQEEVSTGYAEGVNTGSIKVSTVSGQVSTDSIKKSIPSPDKGQREGKAPMIIEEAPKKTKEQILQEEASLAEAIRLDTLEKEEEAKQVHLDSLLAQRLAEEEELNEQQKQRRAQVQFEAQHYTDEDWDLIRAKIEANAELSKSVLGSGLQGEDFAKKMVELVNQRKKHFAEERARAKRNKPMTQSQLRTYMMNYLKNQGTWKLSQLKNLSFEEVKEEFDKLVKQVESFAPINFEATKDSLKKFGEEFQTNTSKRLKSDEAKDDESTKKTRKRRKQIARKGLHSDKTDEDESEASKDVDPILGKKSVYQIVRENGTDIVYINFGAMLKDITRDYLTELYRIVMNRYGLNGPEDKLKKVCKAMLDKKLQGGKPDEDCYKLLKMMEKQAGIRK